MLANLCPLLKVIKMKIQIWSDVACPFCYIGKHRFEKALEKFSEKETVEVEWKSFQLDPSLPNDKPLPLKGYLEDTKGMSSAQVENMFAQVAAMGKEDGLNFNFHGAKAANTFLMHQIIQLAKTKGLGYEAKERFFKAYFSENCEYWSHDVIRSIAKEIGLDPKEVDTVISEQLYADKVRADIGEAQKIGIRGVPFFLFDGQYAISGAQPVNTFLEMLNKVAGESAL